MSITTAPVAPPFAREEFAARLRKVSASIEQAGLDALVVTVPENIFYLTGFSTPAYYATQALVVQPGEEPFLFTYASEAEGVARTTGIEEVVAYGPGDQPARTLAQALKGRALDRGRLGFELRSFFFTVAFSDELLAHLSGVETEDASWAIESARAVKSEAEIQYIRRAAKVASDSMRAVQEQARPGSTENDLAAAAYASAIRAGGEFPGSPPYISSGWRTTLPHASWSGRRIEPGDLVYTELSGCIHRYSAALMRTFTLGELPATLARLEEATITGLEDAIAKLRPGVRSGDVDEACRAPLREAGFEYPHETGYSIGICYPPGWNETHVFNLKAGDDRTVQQDMTFHLVPHVIVPGIGTVGLSETVLVGRDQTEVLTDFPRQVVRLGGA